jgi:hypothetical protein
MFAVMWEDFFDFLLQVIYQAVGIIITGIENEWRVGFFLLSRCKLRSKKGPQTSKTLSV